MSKEFSRMDRLSELIQREIAILIQSEVKDPRLGMVTVNDVTISKDLSYAKVYVTVFVGKNDIDKNIEILNKAANYLRNQLGRRIKSRIIPQLTFIYDETIIEGNRLSKLIDDAIKTDSKKNEDEL